MLEFAKTIFHSVDFGTDFIFELICFFVLLEFIVILGEFIGSLKK